MSWWLVLWVLHVCPTSEKNSGKTWLLYLLVESVQESDINQQISRRIFAVLLQTNHRNVNSIFIMTELSVVKHSWLCVIKCWCSSHLTVAQAYKFCFVLCSSCMFFSAAVFCTFRFKLYEVIWPPYLLERWKGILWKVCCLLVN